MMNGDNSFRPEHKRANDLAEVYADAVEFAQLLETSSLGTPQARDTRRLGIALLAEHRREALIQAENTSAAIPAAAELERFVGAQFEANGQVDQAELWYLSAMQPDGNPTPQLPIGAEQSMVALSGAAPVIGPLFGARRGGHRRLRVPKPFQRGPLAVFLAAAAVVLLAFLAGGIPNFGGEASRQAAQAGGGGDRVVVLVTGTANEFRPMLTPRALQELRAAANSTNVTEGPRGKSSTAVITTADGQSRPPVMLTPRRANGDIEHGPQRVELIEKQVQAVANDVTTASTTKAPDILTGIAAATRGSSPGALIVVSNGLNTSGDFDLRASWNLRPTQLVDRLRARDALPKLDGWTVLFTGLGNTAGDQPPLPSPLQNQLAAYWDAICKGTSASSCQVDNTPFDPILATGSAKVPIVPIPDATTTTYERKLSELRELSATASGVPIHPSAELGRSTVRATVQLSGPTTDVVLGESVTGSVFVMNESEKYRSIRLLITDLASDTRIRIPDAVHKLPPGGHSSFNFTLAINPSTALGTNTATLQIVDDANPAVVFYSQPVTLVAAYPFTWLPVLGVGTLLVTVIIMVVVLRVRRRAVDVRGLVVTLYRGSEELGHLTAPNEPANSFWFLLRLDRGVPELIHAGRSDSKAYRISRPGGVPHVRTPCGGIESLPAGDRLSITHELSIEITDKNELAKTKWDQDGDRRNNRESRDLDDCDLR
jgi:hypothetical protein